MRALSIRQPYAELILRGLKTIEYRSRATKIIGERFYIYAARKWSWRDATVRERVCLPHQTIFDPAFLAAATIRSAVRTAAKPACASTVGRRPERTAARKSSICNFSGS